MAITTSPFLTNDAEILLSLASGGTPVEYRCQLRRAEVVPSTGASSPEMETYCETHTGAAAPQTWTVELEGFQALDDAEDLTRFLLTNAGEDLNYDLAPKGGVASATNPHYTGVCIARATNIGGVANSFAQFTVTLPCTATPTEVVI